MTENISIIRQAGFFKKYETQREIEFSDTLYEITNDLYSIASQDEEWFLDIDLEADVCADNLVYTSLLDKFSKASNGFFKPTDIEEIWNSEEGPIKLNFVSNGQTIIFEPEYMDDWIDGQIFRLINAEMKKVSTELFYLCSGPNDEWFGQNVIFIRLTESEKDLLADKLEWKFSEE